MHDECKQALGYKASAATQRYAEVTSDPFPGA